VKTLSKILDREEAEIPAEVECQNIPKFKHVPITSVDAERSFSPYKLVLGENRLKSESDNIEKILLIYCAANFQSLLFVFLLTLID
jgi:hypothetical protein